MAWNSSHLGISLGFITLNALAQFYYVGSNQKSTSSILTHTISKVFAALAVIDILHNGSAAFFRDRPASLPVQILTGLGFCVACSTSGQIFGGCLVYGLLAFAAGQSGDWQALLVVYALAAAGISTVRNIAK